MMRAFFIDGHRIRFEVGDERAGRVDVFRLDPETGRRVARHILPADLMRGQRGAVTTGGHVYTWRWAGAYTRPGAVGVLDLRNIGGIRRVFDIAPLTRCKRIEGGATHGDFYVEDLKGVPDLDSWTRFDAEYRGIEVSAEWVEVVT